MLTEKKHNEDHDHGAEGLVPVRRKPAPYSPVEQRAPPARTDDKRMWTWNIPWIMYI